MTNTISGFSGNGTASVGTSRTTSPAPLDTAVAATADSQAEGGDQVSITSTASRLAGLSQQLNASPVVDTARVARISQALAAGTYSVSGDQIASGLLQSDQGLAQIGL